jgi:hypothetical protein
MPSADSLAEEVARLYALAPDAFVAERNSLSKAWKREGRKDEATVIAGLRKPSVVESALNRTARRDPATTGAWGEAARRADAAQSAAIGGGEAADLRQAMAELRTATAALVDAAVRTIGDEAKRDDIAALLRTMPVGGVPQVIAGVLGSAPVPDDELFAGAPAPPRRSRPATRAAKPADSPRGRTRRPAVAPAAVSAAAPRPSARARKLEAQVEQRRSTLAASDAALDVARRDLDEARERLARIESQRDEAAAALDAAEAERRAEVEHEDDGAEADGSVAPSTGRAPVRLRGDQSGHVGQQVEGP